MKESNIYIPLWKRYLPVISVQMRNAQNGVKEIKMRKSEFEVFGNRAASNYFINLEINNGKVVNNINGTAVARDLYDVLISHESCKMLLANKYYKFSLGKEFILRISVQ
jgi:hypothetical protein